MENNWIFGVMESYHLIKENDVIFLIALFLKLLIFL